MQHGRAHPVRSPRASRPLRLALRAAVSLAIAGIALPLGADDAPPPQQPNAAAPDSPLVRNLRTALSNLNDPNPVVREQAQRKLLNLRRSDLDALRAVVQERLPLTPPEGGALRGIAPPGFRAG